MPTLPVRYALGRNTTFKIQYPANTGQSIFICVSEGSIDLSSDVIEIPSNCYGGWKIKLSGNKSGTVSVTGYIASGQNASDVSNLQPYKWIGEVVTFECDAYDQQASQAQALSFSADGVVTGVRVSIDANDALRCEMTIEVSGEPVGFAGIAST